jgi:hypothetical protein
MANTMDDMISTFISENGLDEDIKDNLTALVHSCFSQYVGFMSKEWLSAPPNGPKTKKEKLDDPTQAENRDDLRKCTAIILNDYCKENGLKIGGNKSDIMDRVWRHVQGDSSDDDLGRASKPKKEIAKKEIHACSSCNAKGIPCAISANEQIDGKWFCFRHIPEN